MTGTNGTAMPYVRRISERVRATSSSGLTGTVMKSLHACSADKEARSIARPGFRMPPGEGLTLLLEFPFDRVVALLAVTRGRSGGLAGLGLLAIRRFLTGRLSLLLSLLVHELA